MPRTRLLSVFDPGILTVAVAYGFLSALARAAGLFGLPLLVLVLVSLWRYCYVLLRSFALGRTRAPMPDIESMNPFGDWAPLLHAAFFMVAIFILPNTPLFADDGAGLGWGGVVALAFSAVFPASAAIMGVTGNLAAAVNPASIASVIGVMGRDYVRLIAVLFVLMVLRGAADRFLSGVPLGGLLDSMAGTWAQLAAYAVIGGAINEHGHDFDLPGEFERRAERDERDRDRAWQATLDRAYASIRSGLVAEGYREIRGLAESEGESLDVYQWLFNRMSAWQDRQHAVSIGVRFIERLLSAGRLHEALDLADQCRRIPGVRFELGPAVRGRLVDYARSVGRHRSADELVAPSSE